MKKKGQKGLFGPKKDTLGIIDTPDILKIRYWLQIHTKDENCVEIHNSKIFRSKFDFLAELDFFKLYRVGVDRNLSTRKTKTKNRNLRVRRFVCLHHKKRPYIMSKNENEEFKFSFSSNCLFHPYSMTKTKISNPPWYVIWSRIINRSL